MPPAAPSPRAAFIAAIAAAAALSTAPTAVAAWSAPVPSPALGATALPNGDILFLASPPDGSEIVRTVLKRRGSAALDAPVVVGPGPGDGMDVAANGDAAIAVGGGNQRIRFADGRLGPAKRVLGSVVTAPNGAMAAVSCGDGSSDVSIRAAGATAFGPAVKVPGPDCTAAGYRLLETAVDGRGTVTIAWWGDGLKTVSVTAAGAVSAAQQLDPDGFGLGTRLRSQISVAANDAGDTVIAWNVAGGLKVARRARTATAFGAAQLIRSPGGEPSINARLAVDARGGVAVPYGYISRAGVAAGATIDAPLTADEVTTVVDPDFVSVGGKIHDDVTTRGDVLAARFTSAVSPPPNPMQTVGFPAVTSLLRRPGGRLLPVTTSLPGSASTLQLGPDGSVLWTEVDGAVRSELAGPNQPLSRPTTALSCAGTPGGTGFATGQAVQTFTAGSALYAASFAGGAVGVEPVPGLASADAVAVAPTGDAAIIDIDDTGAAKVALRASGTGIGPAPSADCGGLPRVDVLAVPDQKGDLLTRVRSGVRRPVTAWLLITGPGVQTLRTVRLAGLGVTTTTVRMPEAIRRAYRAPERPNIRLTVLTSAGATASGRVVG